MSKRANQNTGLWLHGSSGRMGQEIQKALLEKADGLRLVGGSALTFEGGSLHQGQKVTAKLLAQALAHKEVEVIVDFSVAEANRLLLDAVTQSGIKGKKVLVGTTGLPPKQIAAWEKAAKAQKLALLIAPNTSVGVLTAVRAAVLAATPLAAMGFDVAIVETHHNKKVDAPSGTAKFFASAITDARKQTKIEMHSVRGGGVFGEHEVRLIGPNEEVTISHRAFSRQLFATGALTLASWLAEQGPGVYALTDVDVTKA